MKLSYCSNRRNNRIEAITSKGVMLWIYFVPESMDYLTIWLLERTLSVVLSMVMAVELLFVVVVAVERVEMLSLLRMVPVVRKVVVVVFVMQSIHFLFELMRMQLVGYFAFHVDVDHETRMIRSHQLVKICLFDVLSRHELTPRFSDKVRAGFNRGLEEGVCTEQIFTKILMQPIRPRIPKAKAHQYSYSKGTVEFHRMNEPEEKIART